MADQSPPTRHFFDRLFTRLPESPTLEGVTRDVYGGEYVPELEAFSFITRTDLRALARALGAGPGKRVVDVGCGRGGPSLWICRETGCTVTGVDYSPVGAADALRRAGAFGVTGRAHFVACDAAALGLASSSQDAAMSVELLQLVPDRLAVMREIARVLRPAAPFAFITWERRGTDEEPLLREAGFTLETHRESSTSQDLERAWYVRLLQVRDQVESEIGTEAVEALLEDADEVLAELAHTRHVFIVARRSPAARCPAV